MCLSDLNLKEVLDQKNSAEIGTSQIVEFTVLLNTVCGICENNEEFEGCVITHRKVKSSSILARLIEKLSTAAKVLQIESK